MVRTWCVAFVTLVVFATAIAGTTNPTALSIAVLDFEAKGVGTEEASILGDRFREELFRTGAFVVLERSATWRRS